MADVLITFDESKYNLAVSNYQTVAADLQEVVDTYNDANTNGEQFILPALTIDVLQNLLKDFESVMFDNITAGQPLTIGGLVLNKEKALEILKKPAYYFTIENKVKEILERLKTRIIVHRNVPFSIFQISTVFDINDEGAVVIKDAFNATLINAFKIWAKTDAAKNILAFAQAVKQAYDDNEIKKCGGLGGNGLVGLINQILPWQYLGASLSIDAKNVAQFNNNTRYQKPV